jgi:single-strand DNA-binding protein
MSQHNLVVLRGTLAAEARIRELPSGSVLGQFDVTTRDGGGTQSVPIAWFDPPGTLVDLAAGTELVVVGCVRRRFFRTGGATQSRTEVVAEKVVPVRRARDVRRALDAASRTLQGADETGEEVTVAASA